LPRESTVQQMTYRAIALGAACHLSRHAYIINSLKRPEEVNSLRGIYGHGFYLIATHADESQRLKHLTEFLHVSHERAKELMARDAEEDATNGQQLTKTFHLADFFIRIDDQIIAAIERITRLIFGHPFTTPSFDEYAMFFAFSASLRSADLSRQVGAVIARQQQILALGANDCPVFGGGLYWPVPDEHAGFSDVENGRDYRRTFQSEDGTTGIGFDSNRLEQMKIVEEIVTRGAAEGIDEGSLRSILTATNSPISDLTEYGRVVHAEMEAMLSCARSGISTQDAVLFCTTFPCHNCAKHIIAAGIKRVVYIEPYTKSKASDFHSESIHVGFQDVGNKLKFEPFVGIGPRRFFDLFSKGHGSGYDLKRKTTDGVAKPWDETNPRLRLQMMPFTYLELERLAQEKVKKFAIDEGDEG
ncbi:deaminase, partial [Planctomycetota bacterium]